jgi:hypothetical protein
MKTRQPSIEQDKAAEARKAELVARAKLKNAAPGAGQLAALADKWGTNLKRLKVVIVLLSLLAASCGEESVTDRMQRQNKLDSLQWIRRCEDARRLNAAK